jgi:hypothetical protein
LKSFGDHYLQKSGDRFSPFSCQIPDRLHFTSATFLPDAGSPIEKRSPDEKVIDGERLSDRPSANTWSNSD